MAGPLLRWQDVDLPVRPAIAAKAVRFPLHAPADTLRNLRRALAVVEGDAGPIVVRH